MTTLSERPNAELIENTYDIPVRNEWDEVVGKRIATEIMVKRGEESYDIATMYTTHYRTLIHPIYAFKLAKARREAQQLIDAARTSSV